MIGLKLKPIYLKEDEILITPPDKPLKKSEYTHHTLTNDLEFARELIRGRKFRKSPWLRREKEEDNVQSLSEFKGDTSPGKSNRTPFVRRNTIRRFTTSNNFESPLPKNLASAAYIAISRRTKSEESEPAHSLNFRLALTRSIKNQLRIAKTQDLEMNLQFEAFQKEKLKQIELELKVDRHLVSEIKIEIAKTQLRLDKLVTAYKKEIKDLLIQEAQVLHRKKKYQAAGEEHKFFIEKEKLRKAIQTRHHDHFKTKDNFDKEIRDLHKKMEETRVHKRSIKKGYSQVRKNFVNLYCNILKEGTDARLNGIRWAIKALWAMDEPVPISSFPRFVDDDSVYFLLAVASKEREMEEFNRKLDKIKEVLQRNRRESPFKNSSHDLWKDVKQRLCDMSKSVVVSRPSTAQVTLFRTIDSDFNRNKAHTELCNIKDNITRLKKEISDLTSAEIKRVVNEHQKHSLKTQLELILHCLIGEKLKEYKRI